MLAGASIEDALRAGCATAALKCRSLGARAGLPTLEELMQLLGEVPRLSS
jgi:sugar/nucleoside kinase (ribokinase family)